VSGLSQTLLVPAGLKIDDLHQQKRLWLSKLVVDNFRNYQRANLQIDAPSVVLIGPNGAGKTNLLEAISLLTPGRGMRRARHKHWPNASSQSSHWSVAATVQSADGEVQIGSGVTLDAAHAGRVMRLEGQTVSQTKVGGYISVSWLAPHMDGIFVDSPKARRRFLDRLVIAFDSAHIGRMVRYEKALRQRSILLTDEQGDSSWLESLEAVLAETAVAVTAARQTLIRDLNQEAENGWLGFPGVRLGLVGDTEQWLADMPALQVEDKLMAAAKTARLAGDMAMPGPHVSDLQATHLDSQTPAYLASTGQQKALLIAVVLAHARLQERRLGKSPLMLLDDVVAHLDADRRSALFEAVSLLGGQCWYSGSDGQQFDDLTEKAQFVLVRPASRSDQTPEFEVQ
jgi:DNA replication and repair protein RecF